MNDIEFMCNDYSHSARHDSFTVGLLSLLWDLV